ncbi:hypothetical protein GY45DRAFT_1332135 [Cubamyces sp. BRFM 1775]|nr:hypothetical protein GY45DRAFT_1332135 [Cubamyces sp. BRFM 1775]
MSLLSAAGCQNASSSVGLSACPSSVGCPSAVSAAATSQLSGKPTITVRRHRPIDPT